ncbi:hypothetical protein JW826_01210 [Candidatus Woesearchaeota archaeon]|nr:hypothetical protein [Candidatus Woesearchaeota archaeon]
MASNTDQFSDWEMTLADHYVHMLNEELAFILRDGFSFGQTAGVVRVDGKLEGFAIFSLCKEVFCQGILSRLDYEDSPKIGSDGVARQTLFTVEQRVMRFLPWKMRFLFSAGVYLPLEAGEVVSVRGAKSYSIISRDDFEKETRESQLAIYRQTRTDLSMLLDESIPYQVHELSARSGKYHVFDLGVTVPSAKR